MVYHENAYGVVRGTYLHPIIITPLALWIDNKFAFKVSRIIELHTVQEANERHAAALRAQMTVTERIRADYNHEKEKNRASSELIAELTSQLDNKDDQLSTSMKKLDILATAMKSLRIIINDRVPETSEDGNVEVTLYVKNNYQGDDGDESSIDHYAFNVFRRQTASINQAICNHKKIYPSAVEFFRIAATPNARNDHKRVKSILQEKGATFSRYGNQFDLPNGMSDEMFRGIIMGVNAARTIV